MSTASSTTVWVVFEYDQGRREELECFDTKAEARRWIQALVADQKAHPAFYQHLACPSYEIEKSEIHYHFEMA